MKSNKWKPLIFGYDMNGRARVFNLNRESNIEDMIRSILGEVTIETYGSDTDPGLIGLDYIPVRFEVKFIHMIKNKTSGKTEFTDGNGIVLESLDEFRGAPEGGFFPYTNQLKELDLTRYQIFSSIDKNNYRDNCFVYA